MRLLLLLSILFVAPFVSHAQFLTDSVSEAGPALLLQPAYPAPNEVVTVSIDNYLSNLYSAEITWYLNGTEIPETKNERELEIQVGDVGSTNIIEAKLVIPQHGTQIIKTTIKPVYLDVIVEPQTHVPDFYIGRALPSTGSLTNLTTIISGSSIPNSDLVFTWRVNNQVVGGGGGRGQSSVSFDTPQGSQIIVSLDVSKLDGAALASRSFTIPSVSPQLRFYEVSTLYGINRKHLTSFNLISNSATILAEPFYLDSRVYNNPDIKNWTIDNNTVTTGGNPYEINFERVDYGGKAKLGFHVRSTSNLLQGARGQLDVNY